MSGNVKKYSKSKGYESLNRNMLQDEDNLSLAAIGLLANLTSYPDGWTVHKTELYNRFAKSGRRVVERAWKELIENNYVVQLRKRNGKKYDYIYYHSQVPFTEDDIKNIEIAEGVPVWDGKISRSCNDGVSSTVQNEQSNKKSNSTVQNEQSKLNSTKRTDNKLTSKEINNKDLDTIDTTSLSKSHNLNSLPNEEKQKLKEEYIKKGFIKNKEKIPEKLAEAIDVFTNNTEQANNYYKVIMIAKKKAEETLNMIFWLENEPELLDSIINAFSRSIRTIEKSNKIKDADAYLYKSILKSILDEFTFVGQATSSDIYYNWLEESN